MSNFPPESDGSLNAKFEKFPLSSFGTSPAGRIISIPSTTSIADAAQILAEHRILAAPVRDATVSEDSGWNEKYIGVCLNPFRSVVLIAQGD
jgi:CBS domain-containing protein